MSFWKSNPFAPSWKACFVKTIRGEPAESCVKGVEVGVRSGDWILQETKEFRIEEIKHTQLDILSEVAVIWHIWYKTTAKSRCNIDIYTIQCNLQSGRWRRLLIAREQRRGQIVGTLVQRDIGWFRVGSTIWEQAYAIDYLCVKGGIRNKGCARALLFDIHRRVAEAAGAEATESEPPLKGGIPPHLFNIEQPQWQIPPLSWTPMVARKGGAAEKSQWRKVEMVGAALDAAWQWAASSGNACSISKLGISPSVRIYTICEKDSSCEKYIAIEDTHFCTSDVASESHKLLQLLGAWPALPSATELEAFIDSIECSNSIVLCPVHWPRESSEWIIDLPTQWISYNVQSAWPCLTPPLLL